MRKIFFNFTFILIFFIAAQSFTFHAYAKESREKVFNAKTHQLENGLQIVVIENPRVPVITHMIWYRVGAADEPPGQSGIAHFLEHLLFKGQKHEQLGSLEPGEFSKIIRSLGGDDNAFTSQDYTAYFQSIASQHLETVMTMEAGRMQGLNVPEEDVLSENKVIQEERRQRTENKPQALLDEQLREVLFANHPYSIPVIGWQHEIQSLTRDQIMDFYNKYYAPNNAILVVSGDVNAEKVFEIAKRTYGLMEKRETPKRVRTTSPPFRGKSMISLSDKNVQQPEFRKIFRVPSYRQSSKESLALQVLEEIMGAGSSSRLYQDLVVKQKIATSASLSYSSDSWDNGSLYIWVTPAPGQSFDNIEKAVDNALRNLVENGVTDDELSDAITRLQAEAIYALDSVAGPAMVIGYSLITGSTLDDIEYWPENIGAVTKEQIQAAAKTYLNPDLSYENPPVTGYLMPENKNSSGAIK
ncbi:MAG: insulinase family protein [Alphaproteobacteria bacterium]|nr:insulinase family protein [Alphaproteobacteria bacterium]